MARNIKNGVSNFPQRMVTSEGRLFLCLEKEKEEDFPTSCQGCKNK